MTSHNRRLALFFSMLLFIPTMGQVQPLELPAARKRAVYGRGYYVSPSRFDYSTLTSAITDSCQTKQGQAQAIYLWVCQHISYDTHTDIRTADEAFITHRAVCQGYCELYYRMAETVGLKTQLVYGRSRNSEGYEEDHSWLSVRTEEGDILMDPTWGAGSVVDGQFRRNTTPLVWFNPNPEIFIHTHLPQNKKHQHLQTPITPEAFDSLEYVRPTID